MTGVGAGKASIRANFAVLMVVLVAFLGAHPADLLAHGKILFGDLGIPLYKPRCLQTDICAVAVELDATCQQGNVLFVQAGSFTFFTSKGTFNKFLQ